MTFLKEISFRRDAEPDGEFPFNLPVIESFDSLNTDLPVTFLVGENGSGKSTVLESIAVGLKCPTLGAADAQRDPMLSGARRLAAALTLSRSKTPRNRLFFRAEDAIGFTRRVMENMTELSDLEAHFDNTLKGYGRQLATGAARGQQEALRSRYGDDPDARSHGEWFLAMLKTRIHPNGLYLLDEPETPLSPIHQLTLLSLLKDWATQNCQFIVATHSPILMALPGARIYAFDQRIEEVAWEDVEHVKITRQFLNDPEGFLRHL